MEEELLAAARSSRAWSQAWPSTSKNAQHSILLPKSLLLSWRLKIDLSRSQVAAGDSPFRPKAHLPHPGVICRDQLAVAEVRPQHNRKPRSGSLMLPEFPWTLPPLKKCKDCASPIAAVHHKSARAKARVESQQLLMHPELCSTPLTHSANCCAIVASSSRTLSVLVCCLASKEELPLIIIKIIQASSGSTSRLDVSRRFQGI